MKSIKYGNDTGRIIDKLKGSRDYAQIANDGDGIINSNFIKANRLQYAFPVPYQEHDLLSISVVIGNWIRNSYVPYSISQVLGQDYPKELLEIIIIDQGSPHQDELQQTCRQIAQENTEVKMRYFQHQEDPMRNSSLRKNTGYRHSSNEVIVTIESDGLVLGDNFLKETSWIHTKNDKTMGKSINLRVTGEGLSKHGICTIDIDTWLPNMLASKKYSLNVFKRMESPCGESIRREHIQRIQGYPEISYGWGDLESIAHNKMCPQMGVSFTFCNRIFSIELPNFPEEPMLSEEFYGPKENSVCSRNEEWGITRDMKEIALYV